MAEEISRQLPDSLLDRLKGEQFVLLATVDAETGAPVVNAVSWVYAPDANTLRVAVGHRSRMIANVKAKPEVTVTVIGPDTTYSIAGKAQVKHDRLEGPQIKLTGIEIDVDAVYDVMFYGAKIVDEPGYVKTYDKEAADKLDRQVTEALQKG
ncbi:nitroreductase/quinone reductase family protein [Melghirimyces algeriensis]|uniref:Pyridoxamine 5'-phosphate oxidase n=1 Tax=Melghirimyces algeriensis TaxID=910412 RepID=A0A521BP24_9BACL|nr:nitroreductase/quinone reductase family protein [Melghirimyces algeriensis]SMO48866.1 Pyridoxamine 5'-phosphate oxidase [Melghirimyces algeriensis]